MSDAEEETNQSVSAPTGNQSHRISLVFFDLTLNFPPGCRPVRLFQVFLKLCDVSVAKISPGQDQQTFFPSVWSQSATNFGVKKAEIYQKQSRMCSSTREKCLTCTSQTKLLFITIKLHNLLNIKRFCTQIQNLSHLMFFKLGSKENNHLKIEGWIFYFLVCFHLDSVLSVIFLRRH